MRNAASGCSIVFGIFLNDLLASRASASGWKADLFMLLPPLLLALARAIKRRLARTAFILGRLAASAARTRRLNLFVSTVIIAVGCRRWWWCSCWWCFCGGSFHVTWCCVMCVVPVRLLDRGVCVVCHDVSLFFSPANLQPPTLKHQPTANHQSMIEAREAIKSSSLHSTSRLLCF
jgi:hypothetical protein